MAPLFVKALVDKHEIPPLLCQIPNTGHTWIRSRGFKNRTGCEFDPQLGHEMSHVHMLEIYLGSPGIHVVTHTMAVE